MYINKMTINSRNVFREEFAGGYALHQAVWNLFGDHPDRRRDFLYRLDTVGKSPLIYAVSERKPDGAKEAWHIESKAYAPHVKAGMRLGFMVRVNPTVTRDGKRHDVVMDAKYKLRATGQAKQKLPQDIILEACGKWLAERSEKNGFKLVQFRADGYRQVNFQKKKTGITVSYSVVDFSGALEVIDEKAFVNMLFKGLGSAKGFGCGLMLVRNL